MDSNTPYLIIGSVTLAALCVHCSGASSVSEASGGKTSGATAGTSGSGGAPAGGGASIGSGAGGVSSDAGGNSLGGGATGGSIGGDGGMTNGAAGGAATSGGSAGNSGSAGSGGAISAAGSGPVANCPAGALLCDDFESYAAMSAPSGKWKVTNVGTASTVVDTTHAFSGTKAAHFRGTVDNNRQYSFMTASSAPTFPVAGNKLYVRFMLYITRWPNGTHTRLLWLGTAQALSTPQRGFDGAGYVLCNYNGIAIERLASGFYRNVSTHLSDTSRVGKWACLETEIDNAGGPIKDPNGKGSGTALPHLWEDDKEYTLTLAGDTSVKYNAIPFEAVQFSIWSPQTDTAVADYWVDDVVMSTQPIHCPAAP